MSSEPQTGLRRARADDRAALQALALACDLPVDGVDPGRATFVMAEGADGALQGCAGLERHGDYGLLRSVAVATAVRGSGVGARLTAAIVDEARRQRLRAVYALTTTASAYFPRFGFEVIGREDVPADVRSSAEFATLCPSTATVLRLVL